MSDVEQMRLLRKEASDVIKHLTRVTKERTRLRHEVSLRIMRFRRIFCRAEVTEEFESSVAANKKGDGLIISFVGEDFELGYEIFIDSLRRNMVTVRIGGY